MTGVYHHIDDPFKNPFCHLCQPDFARFTRVRFDWNQRTIAPRRETVYRIKPNPTLNPTSAWVGIGRGYIDPAQGPPQTEEGQGSDDVLNSDTSFHCPFCEGTGSIISDDRWRPEICEKC